MFLLRIISVASTLAVATGVSSGGGWVEAPSSEKKAPPEWAMVDASSCPMKRVSGPSLTKLPSIPTIITDVADAWPIFKDWQSKAKFLEKFGDVPITHSPTSGPLQFFVGDAENKTEMLRDFASDMSGKQAFVVEDNKITVAAGKWKLPKSRWKFAPQATLSLGGHGQGLPFHAHGASWLALITGMKVWFLYPPEMPEEALDTIGITPMKKWAEMNYISKMKKQYMVPGGGLRGRPMRCLQQQGEIMFIPAYWWHATYNMGESLAVGSQSKLFPEEVEMAWRKYPDGSLVLHNLMLRSISGGDTKKALEYGELAMKASPYDPKIAIDHALLLRTQGDEAGCQRLVHEYIAKIDKLRSEDLVLASEAESAKKQLQKALRLTSGFGEELDEEL